MKYLYCKNNDSTVKDTKEQRIMRTEKIIINAVY